MRTNIDINDDLLEEAKKLTNIKVKKDLVHEALRTLIAVAKRKPLTEIRGKVNFLNNHNYKNARSGN